MFTTAIVLFLAVRIVVASCEFVKCCENGYALNENLKCVAHEDRNETVFDVLNVTNKTALTYTTCFETDGGRSAVQRQTEPGEIENATFSGNACLEISTNGTVVTQTCTKTTTSDPEQCDSLFMPLNFWGVNIVVFANMIYVFPYLIVVIFYFAIPDLRRRAYDKAVLCYNGSQFVIAVILLVMGYFVLCHKPLLPMCYIFLGLTLMFLTISSVFWLFIICFDMTLVITRFRWIPSNGANDRDESKKFTIYSICAWVGAFVPTAFACLMELIPWIPKTSVLKPNYERFDDGTNLPVIIYGLTLPVITCVMNNVLFIYTTYKIIQTQKSTAIANENKVECAKKKYFVFLRLYLLMDAPWIIGIMAAVYTDLWVLKFCRMVQPILMLFAILPKQTYSRVIQCLGCSTTSKNGECKCKNVTVISC